MLNHLLELLLPARCLLCEQGGISGRLCPACEGELPWLWTACVRCALPLPAGNSECGHCLRRPPSFDACLACFCYQSPVDRLVSRFKHQRRVDVGVLLAGHLLERLRQRPSQDLPDLITAVPLHWRRHLQRGFNQAQTVAEVLAHGLQLPLASLARRSVATPRQQRLGRRQRLANLRNVFTLPGVSDLEGRRVALVDDVLTTGATCEALAALFKGAGAQRVEVWTLARTPAPD